MTWDVATAKTRLGIETDDTSKDIALQAALDVALSVAEGYCDRRFLLEDDVDEFWRPTGPTVLVRRYPLVKLTTIAPLDPQQAEPPPEPQPAPTAWRIDKKRGIVFMRGAGFAQPVTPVGAQPQPYGAYGFVLGYLGGYDPLPPDLEAALWMVFDQAWMQTPGWGADAGSQSSNAGAVKSFAIDGMRVEYDSAASAGSGGAGTPDAWGLIPASAIAILNFYRAESVAIGG
jgi:hypothetical protein